MIQNKYNSFSLVQQARVVNKNLSFRIVINTAQEKTV